MTALLADAGGSMWNIKPWEAALPLLLALGSLPLLAVLSRRARENRAKLRRQRRAERALVRRLRTW